MSTALRSAAAAACLVAGVFAWQPQAQAAPIPCLICGSTPLVAPGVDATVSFAVVPGGAFLAELAPHGIGFFGLVPSGTLGPPVPPLPTDFVYMYQLVNTGVPDMPNVDRWTISGGGIGAGTGAITAGTRLESTLFVQPSSSGPPALISAGPVLAPTAPGLSGAPVVDFQNGLGLPLPGDPVFPPWGPCLGSGAVGVGVNCSDGTADLLAASISVYGWLETPSAGTLDPNWTSSIIWIASPFGPVPGTTVVEAGAGKFWVAGGVPVPAIPEPASWMMMGLGVATLAVARLRRRRPEA